MGQDDGACAGRHPGRRAGQGGVGGIGAHIRREEGDTSPAPSAGEASGPNSWREAPKLARMGIGGEGAMTTPPPSHHRP
jgi:hypothetical protein